MKLPFGQKFAAFKVRRKISMKQNVQNRIRGMEWNPLLVESFYEFEQDQKKLLNSSATESPTPKARKIPPPPQGLKAKWKKFWEATLRASARNERFSTLEKVKQHIWHYNLGQVKGALKGLYEGAGTLLNPRSNFHKLSPSLLYQEIPELGGRVLDYGTAYMDADWRERGEMAGKATVKTGLAILSLRNAHKGIQKILREILR